MGSITKEIKAYLGTGLKMKSPNGFRPNGKESTGNPGEVYLTGDLYADIENNTFKGEVFKPMLWPLSILTQEIEHNDKKINPIIELARLATNINDYDANNEVFVNIEAGQLEITNKKGNRSLFAFDDNDKSFFLNHDGKTITANNQLKMFEKLYEWHFDIHGLIGRGLAIDKSNSKP